MWRHASGLDLAARQAVRARIKTFSFDAFYRSKICDEKYIAVSP